MNFDKFFRFISYAVVFCGFLTLWVSGGSGLIVSTLFIAVLVSAWFLEDSRWQVSDRIGTALMFVVVPLFYVDWKYKISGFGTSETAIVAILAKLILLLAAIKLFQKKGDRDWMFLYLMSFFEVLLAAGVSISPLFLGSLILYSLAALCAIIAFEIRKTSRIVNEKSTGGKPNLEKIKLKNNLIKRLPSASVTLLFLIIVVAAPLFFMLPRVGGAGFGSNKNAFSSITGFSDTVNLGQIGQLKQNEEVVMRARLENAKKDNLNSTRWRGVALDTFNNKTWSKSSYVSNEIIRNEREGIYNLDKTERQDKITVQTIYLEPIDTPVLFILARPLAVQGNFINIKRDAGGAINFLRKDFDRLSYKVFSDTSLPTVTELRDDKAIYSPEAQRYLQLPEKMDERISELAARITETKTTRYDKASAVEKFLQTQYGYTLDLRVGGEEPLADFLFNVKEGHCEYFASSMAIMLRTQGIATRIVNGFQLGEYNETADVYVVKQKSAQTWVEVYFPGENVWVPFDPTPYAGQNDGSVSTGAFSGLTKYIEALETFWIQYFVAYDSSEQRSLFRNVKNSFQDYQSKTSSWLNDFQDKIGDWWRDVRGDKGLQSSAAAIAYGFGYLVAFVLGIFLTVWLYRKIIKLEIWQKLLAWLRRRHETTIVEFYEKMQKVLASKGLRRDAHQTPLEFAFALNMPEAVSITEKYNRVRFGEKKLSPDEAKEIENWLKTLAESPVESAKK